MKKTLFMLGLMFTALTLSNCTKTEEQDVVPGKPNENAFELFATPTRTTTDGMSTSWAAADEINVFHAVAGTTNYVHNTATASFSIAEEDLATGRFLGSLAEELDPSTNYDWYVFYPYTKQIVTPANTDGGYVYIGQRSDKTQTQNGNSDMSHVSGENCPLYGIATNVPGSQTPDIVMHHLTSVLEVVVTNNAEEEITVSRIKFKTANTDVVGTYYVDFSSDDIVYNPHEAASFISNTATLNITDGTPIAVGESAKFYLAIKPFTTSNETLTLTVTTDKGVCEKSIDLTSETSFVAGNIKPLNIGFAVEPGTDPEPLPKGWARISNLNQIVEGEYIIVVKTNSSIGYLPTNETSTPTFKTDITVDEENGLITSGVSDNMKWTFSGTASSMTITNINGDALYITNTNKGVKVGASADFRWIISAHDSGVANTFMLTSSSVKRFLGVYGNQDWRCYETIGTFNENEGSSCKIYLYLNNGALPQLDAPTNLEANSNGTITWDAVENAGSYTVTVGSVSETVSETSYTYTGEAGIFDVSVVANPADASAFMPSAAATLTEVKFGEPAIDSPVVSVSGITVDGFTASWPAVANASGYLADVTTDAEGLNSVGSIAETPGDPYTITVTGLAESTEYYLHVYAIANEGYTDAPVVTTAVTTRTPDATGTVTDILVASAFVATNTQYRDFSGVTFTSNAIYAGNNAKTSNGGIQLRKSSNTQGKSGIVTTASGGRAAKVVVTWESGTKSGRTLNIYGSNTPYTSAADLYDTSTQGTLIGTIVCGTSTELVIEGNYPYIAMRSKDGTMYLTQIEITWEK